MTERLARLSPSDSSSVSLTKNEDRHAGVDPEILHELPMDVNLQEDNPPIQAEHGETCIAELR